MTEPKSVSAKQLRDALVEELEKSGIDFYDSLTMTS